jgi:hypothetical protein
MTRQELVWLAGDHHVHTAYSSDGIYSVGQQAEAAARHGLAWLVVTDHGGPDHAKFAVRATHADVIEARAALPQLLLYQGLEWNVPGTEHGTIFFAPGRHEAELLEEFERQFDGVVVYGDRCTDRSLAERSMEGLRWMGEQVRTARSSSALFVVNHPSRRGLVAPALLRAWNELSPDVAVGMEAAPGHQAAGARGERRGIYDQTPTAESFSGYPPESYRTIGGFDWMTATVGGVWDALLAEGRRWWITANSDGHAVGLGPGSTHPGRDFWPGAYSRTVVGAREASYPAVMEGIRKGRMWVVHGDLISSLDVGLRRPGSRGHESLALGGEVTVPSGADVELYVRIGLPKVPNGSGQLPRLARVDVIVGAVRRCLSDADACEARRTAVVASFDVAGRKTEVTLRHRFRRVDSSFYVRLRGTDGNVHAMGSIEPGVDRPDIDPWSDLWFYSNPVFVDVTRHGRPPRQFTTSAIGTREHSHGRAIGWEAPQDLAVR